MSKALAVERHQVKQKPTNIKTHDITEADFVFAGGDPSQYLPLLRWVREKQPTLPFVVVTNTHETKAWLEALEAGATDYCCVPFKARTIHWLRQIHLLMEAVPPEASVPARSGKSGA